MNILIGFLVGFIILTVFLILTDSEVTGLSIFAVIIIIVFMALLSIGKKEATIKARMINREYGTEYTAEEVFYAEDIIDTIQQIKRTRIDIQ